MDIPWDSQQGRDRNTSTLVLAFWNFKLKVLKCQWNFRPHAWSKNLVRPLICMPVWLQFRFPRALMNSTAEIESVCTKKLDLRKKGVNFLYSKATRVDINSEGAFIFICLSYNNSTNSKCNVVLWMFIKARLIVNFVHDRKSAKRMMLDKTVQFWNSGKVR